MWRSHLTEYRPAKRRLRYLLARDQRGIAECTWADIRSGERFPNDIVFKINIFLFKNRLGPSGVRIQADRLKRVASGHFVKGPLGRIKHLD